MQLDETQAIAYSGLETRQAPVPVCFRPVSLPRSPTVGGASHQPDPPNTLGPSRHAARGDLPYSGRSRVSSFVRNVIDKALSI